jgi:dipeptidyl aminopeptidase/acylaminoacyl peptidase
MERPGYEADRFGIVLRDRATGATRRLAADWDRSPGGLAFSPDGATLWATAADVGQVSLFAIDVASGAVREVVGEGHVREPAMVPGAGAGYRVLFGRDSLTAPVELYTVAADGSGLTRLTAVNREELAGVALGRPEQFSFAGAGGDTVYGWVVAPADFDPARRYPVAFLIHGGPQGSFGNDFHYRWNPQVYAGAGYGSVMIDFHGSIGYGQAFTDAIRGDWGGKPLEDLQKGLAAALARYPWLDGDRACALGASYGGYMINWIAGKWPAGFDCLVNHDGIFDQRMMYYATEELWFPEWEHGGPYFAHPEGYELHNPAHLVTRWRTPMLVIHGALDYRVPETQAFATFTALQRRGVPSRLLHFPDENHWVLEPANSILWHETVLAWLDRWTKGQGEETTE